MNSVCQLTVTSLCLPVHWPLSLREPLSILLSEAQLCHPRALGSGRGRIHQSNLQCSHLHSTGRWVDIYAPVHYARELCIDIDVCEE